MWQYNYTDELYHYGVPGMKWGVRNFKQEAKQQYKARKDKAFEEYEQSINKIERSYKKGQNLSDKDVAREEAVEKKYNDAVAKAKADYKTEVKNFKDDVKAGGPSRRVKIDPKTGDVKITNDFYDSRGNKISSEHAQKIETAVETSRRKRNIARGVGTATSVLASIGAAAIFQMMQNR